MMGGQIWFDSEEGRGSTFRFTAVFEKQQAAAETPATAPAQAIPERPVVRSEGAGARRSREQPAGGEHVVDVLGLPRRAPAGDTAAALVLLQQAARDGDPFAIAMVDKEMPAADCKEVVHRIVADPLLDGHAPAGHDAVWRAGLRDAPAGLSASRVHFEADHRSTPARGSRRDGGRTAGPELAGRDARRPSAHARGRRCPTPGFCWPRTIP